MAVLTKNYITALTLGAMLSVTLATTGCFQDDDPATGGEAMMPDDGDGMMPDGSTSEPVAFMAGVDRVFASDRTVGLTDDGSTMVVEDATQTPSGWNLTVGGRAVEFDASDYNASPFFPEAYYKDVGNNEEAFFWSVENGGFEGNPGPEFGYLDVYGFVYSIALPDADLATATLEDFERATYTYILHGTPSGDMPVSGNATYDGRVEAREWPSDDAVSTRNATVYTGDFDMTASFNATGASVAGTFSFDDVPDGDIPFTVDVTGNQLSVSGLSITEGPFAGYQNIGVRGAFFGPAAAEVGGVFEGENPTANTLMHGFFAGDQTQDDQ